MSSHNITYIKSNIIRHKFLRHYKYNRAKKHFHTANQHVKKSIICIEGEDSTAKNETKDAVISGNSAI